MKHNFFPKRVVIVIFSVCNIFISNSISYFYSRNGQKICVLSKVIKHKITLTILFRLFYLNYEYEHAYTYSVTNTCFILKWIE